MVWHRYSTLPQFEAEMKCSTLTFNFIIINVSLPESIFDPGHVKVYLVSWKPVSVVAWV
jgi:hypothetical protein